MEWSLEESADIRRAEEALERIRLSLRRRGKWWWSWRLLDVQHELQAVKREVLDGQHGQPIGSGPDLGRITTRDDARLRSLTRAQIPAAAGISSGGEGI
jgi:hypothetical protein